VTAPDHTLAVLTARAVGVDYRTVDRVVTAVDDVSIDVQHAQMLVLAGPSGSGKSSLLRALGLLDRPTRGGIHLGGIDTDALGNRARRQLRRHHLAYVHQRPVTNLVDDLTAAEQVRFARAARGLPVIDPHGILTQFGIGGRSSAHPAHLSGGEQQRLAIAMAAAVEPAVLFADEPTAELDRHHADEVIAALVQVANSGRAVVVASHDPSMLSAAHVVLRLREGRMEPS
jgi:putative ABC transport system ATP-binding protein